MERTVNTYSPNDVSLQIGSYICGAWKLIEIDRSVKGYKKIRGIRGKNTRVPNVDNSANIRIQIMQTSHTNDVFSLIHEKDLLEKTGRLSVTLKDKSGSSVFHSNEAYIEGYPKTIFSDDIVFHEWEIFCQSTSIYRVGGNNTPETKLFDSLTSALTNLIN